MNWQSEQGYKELFESFYNVLCNYAYKILQNDMYSEDVVIDVFVKLWNQKDKLTIEEGKLKSYLFSSVRNGALGVLRNQKTKDKYEQVYAEISALKEEDQSQEEDLFIFRELLKRSLRQLPPKSKEVYLLRTQNGLTFAEIADELKISRRTAENQMANAVKKLRTLILEQKKLYNI